MAFDPTEIFRALRLQNILRPTNPYIDESGAFNPSGINAPLNLPAPRIQQPSMQAPINTSFDRPTRQIWERPEDDISARMKELYQPDTRATDQLYKMLEEYPQKEKPGKLRKIAGIALGVLGGPQVYEQIAYQPYYNKMADYQRKFGTVKDVAEQERLQNTNLRQIASSVLSNEAMNRRLDIQEENYRNRDAVSRMRAESYVALNKFKMENPEWEIVKQEGGNYMLLNPKTGETKDTGIKTGTMSEVDEINLRIRGAKEVAAIPRTVYGTSTTSTVTPPGSEIPTQAKQRMINNATRLINEGLELPDGTRLNIANVIEFDRDTGLPVITKKAGDYVTGNRFFGGRTITQDEINKINEAINEEKPAGPATTSTTTRTSTSTRGGRPTGSVVEPAPKPATNNAIPLVPVAQRIVGQIYILGNGRKGKWDGSAFDPVN